MAGMRRIAVFDVDLPTGLAFVRSLGAAGASLTAYSSSKRAAGRYSRFVSDFRPCPPVDQTDEFIGWLTEEISNERIDLIAPTSDDMTLNAAEVFHRVGRTDTGLPRIEALLDVLLKDRFAIAMARAGFPGPTTMTPTSLTEALTMADAIGYPVVLKPRSHVGIGRARGTVVHTPEGMGGAFRPYDLWSTPSTLLQTDPDLTWPILQEFIDRPKEGIVSISGCLGADGDLLAIGHSCKLLQWPAPLGIGTLFESLPQQPFTVKAIDAVRSVLGRGIFELEVVYDPETGQALPIDLNPRAFGQISLDVASGRDLPRLWYSSCGAADELRPPRPLPTEVPRYWVFGLPFYTGAAISAVAGPDRRLAWRDLTRRGNKPRVGAVHDRGDRKPSLAFVLHGLRHFGGIVRPFLGSVARDVRLRRSAIALGLAAGVGAGAGLVQLL